MPIALGLIELIFIGLFFLLMVIGTVLDRRYNESPKWWILGLAFVIAIMYFWGETDFSSIWAASTSWQFWKPVLLYLAAGLAYSVLEFVLAVRKMAAQHRKNWASHMTKTIVTHYAVIDGVRREVDSSFVRQRDGKMFHERDAVGGRMNYPVEREEITYSEALREALAEGSKEGMKLANEIVYRYVTGDEYTLSDMRKDFITIELNENTMMVEPTINRSRLASFIGCWTFLWPFYAVSLVLGDLLLDFFKRIGDLFSFFGGRLVRVLFNGVFKV